MVSIGDDAGLRAREGCGLNTTVGERHRHERHGDTFAAGEEHVHFPRRSGARHVTGESNEVISGFAHGGDHDHDVVAGATRARDVIGDRLDAIGVADGGPAVLLHD